MQKRKWRYTLALAGLAILAVLLLAGCGAGGSKGAASRQTDGTGSASGRAEEVATIKLGVLPIIDNLPFWVAEEKGYFKAAGLKVELIPFPSAVERDSALTAGQIDGALGDLLAVAELNDAGTPVKAISLGMGAKAGESRFAVLSAPNSGITKASQLKGVPIGVSLNSIIEYVTDRLLEDQGLTAGEIKKASIPKMPVRMESLLNGTVKAATLPDPLATLAAIKGAHIVADTMQDNVAQTVIMMRSATLDKELPAVRKLMQAYGKAVVDIQANPQAFNGILIREARVPAEVFRSKTYKMPVHFSAPQLPAQQDVAKVQRWMKEHRLLHKSLGYNDLVDSRVLGGAQ